MTQLCESSQLSISYLIERETETQLELERKTERWRGTDQRRRWKRMRMEGGWAGKTISSSAYYSDMFRRK